MKQPLIVLVADDDPQDLRVMSIALHRNASSARVFAVQDGEQAIEYLRGINGFENRLSHPFPDLLVLDLKMQKLGGLEVLAWIRKQPDCNRLPVIMLSGSGLDKDVEEAYRRGAATYFAKPTSFKDFQQLIKTVIDYWTRSERPRKVESCY